MAHDIIAVLDFGGQYAHLIANRIRRLGVYSVIVDNETPASELKKYKGLVLSGGPDSVNDPKAPSCDPAIFKLSMPILAICYGHQLMQHLMGGRVDKGSTKEYGLAEFTVIKPEGILKNAAKTSRIWMSHFDQVQKLAGGFEIIGSTKDCPTAAVADLSRNYFGIQFHAEVTHTQEGQKLLNNFLDLCDVSRDWDMEEFMKEEIEKIRQKVGDKKVFLLVSGGVDSTVCFALLEKALGQERVYGMLVDHGLMRYQEADRVKMALNQAGFHNLHVADKSKLFLDKLAGITDPEAKRKIIGDLFWEVKESEAERLGLNPNDWIMGQGTIYPDTIESGGTKHADKIKTHHNRVDLVQEMIAAGKVIEPIADLYKDEVRHLGEKLGLPHSLVWRHPFPGPGLGVRILCSDGSVEMQNFASLQNEITKFLKTEFGPGHVVRILPCKSVGVQGDERTYRHPVGLFTHERHWEKLEEISTAITNRFDGVNRVILALKGVDAEFKLKSCSINQNRVELLQRVDDLISKVMEDAPSDYGIWQFPVILIPTATEANKESIVLRPIVSTDAMTANFAAIDWQVLENMVRKIEEPELTHIFYDLTHKPPGTIEWE